MLLRCILPADLALQRMNKALPLQAISGRVLHVDGYNVLITVESLLLGHTVYLCDDGFLRDTRGFFYSNKRAQAAPEALSQTLDLLKEAGPSFVRLLFDQQISLSGELAARARHLLKERSMRGEALSLRDVDHQLKCSFGIIASSDGAVIDNCDSAIDLPAEIASRLGISPRII